MPKYILIIFAFYFLPEVNYPSFNEILPNKASNFNGITVKSHNNQALIQKRCNGAEVELYTTATGNFQWQKDGTDIANENASSYKPTTAGTYRLMVDGMASNEIAINFDAPTASFTHNASNSACGSETVTFTNTSTNAETYLWDFGDGSTSTEKNPTHEFKAGLGTGNQTFAVRLTVTSSGCKSNVTTQNITVKRLPDVSVSDADIFSPFSNCDNSPGVDNPNFTLKINNTSSNKALITSYSLDWGDGTTQTTLTDADFPLEHTYTQLGAFQLKVTGTYANGCSNTKTYMVANQSNPAGGLGTLGSTTGLCVPAKVPFIITNWKDNAAGTQYILDFGDGTSTTFSHPLNATGEDHKVEHIYTKSSCPQSAFKATLTVKNACDETQFTADNVQINVPPVSDFVPSTLQSCVDADIRFNNKTKYGYYGSGCSTATIYEWDFGDGTTSTLENPTHAYSNPGNYTVTLKATNPCGTSVKTEEICVNPKPIANFSLPQTVGCAPFTLKPTNTSNSPIPNCGTNTYQWTVTSVSGTDCGIAAAAPVYINSTSASSESPELRFDKPGKYKIRLTVKNANGTCTNVSAEQEITVKAPPTAVINITPTPICTETAISPTATVKNCYATDAVTYLWEFPGANVTSSTDAAPTNIVYASSGNYTITLKVTNECGTNTYTKQITVNPTPVLSAKTDITVCNGEQVNIGAFTNEASLSGVSYNWTNSNTAIGLSASGTGNISSFTARTTGTTPITATISVTPKTGSCTGDAKTFTITVNPAAQVADAGADQNLCNVTSTTLNGSAASLGGEWSVLSGTGISFADKTDPKTEITGLQAGTYELQWTVKGYAPCPSSSDKVLIIVAPLSVGGSTSGATKHCGSINSGTVTLTGHVGNVIRWERSTNGTTWTTVSPNNTSTTLNYSNLSTSTSFRAVVQSGSCATSTSAEAKIEIAPIPAAPTTTTAISYCLNETVGQLTASGNNLKWYKALPVSAANLLSQAPTPNTSATGTIKYYVTQTDNDCESAPTEITITVNPAISNNAISADQTICLNGTPLPLKTTSGNVTGGNGSITYQWQSSTTNVAADFSDIASATSSTYQPGALSQTTYFRRIANSGTCSATSNIVTITVQGTLNNIDIGSNQTICNGSVPQKLTGEVPSGGSGTFSYTWQKSITSATTGFTTIAGATDVDYQPTTLTQTTHYRRMVVSGSCNAVSSVVTIKVLPLIQSKQLPDLLLCNSGPQSAINFETDDATRSFAFTWTNDQAAIGLAANGTGNLPAFTATNANKKPLVANIAYSATFTEDGTSCPLADKSFAITVLPGINITTTLNDLTICAGQKNPAITLNNDAEAFAGASVKYRWTVSQPIGLAAGEGLQLPEFTGINSGKQPVSATITITPIYTYNGKSCEGVPKSFELTVNPAPDVAFSLADQTLCNNTTSAEVTLSSSTADVAFSWTAQPVAGLTGLVMSGTDKIPAQDLVNNTTAPVTAVFKAKATTTGGASCDGLEQEYRIVVNPTPNVTASATKKTICSNQKVDITLSTTVPGTKFYWTVSGNSNITGAMPGSGSEIAHQLTNTSAAPQTLTYTVTPVFETDALNCDGSPITIEVTVNPAPTVSFSSADVAVCSGTTINQVNLSSATPAANISWTVNAPAGITGITATSGKNTIPAQTLANTSNTPLKVVYTATAKTNDDKACAGVPVNYTVTVYPVSRLTNSELSQNVCSGTSSTAIALKSNVAAAVFSWTATASSPSLSGFASSGKGDIPPQSLTNTDTEAHKITYQISTSAYCCDETSATYEIYVQPSPVFTSSQSATELCSGTPFVYEPKSSTSGVSFTWTRAAVNGISNPAASGSGIDAAGSINETLNNTTLNPIEVTYEYQMSINGCSTGAKIPIVVKVNPLPTAKFGLSAQRGCGPFTLTIQNLNSRTLNNTYTVDFGDGSDEEVFNDESDIVHTYENQTDKSKIFYLTITTSNQCGKVTSIPYEIVVEPQSVYSKLALQASDSFGCAPFRIDFTTLNQSTGANLFTWDFGDGSPVRQTRSVNEEISHVFAKPGDYTITLTATNGCSTVSSTQVVTVYPQVNTSFTIDKVQECVGKEISFTNNSDAQFSSLWDFGDGTSSTETNPKHIYTTGGTKTITLRATRNYPNGGSCTAVFTRTVEILAAPVSSFSTNAATLNCNPFTLEVTANATDAVNIEWNFGDDDAEGNLAYGLKASHTYTKPGDYAVTAKAYNSQGCFSVSTQYVRITESPLAAFTPSATQICGTTANLSFKNETQYQGGDAVSYKWMVNGSEVATSKHLNYNFSVPNGTSLPQVFKVKLEAQNIVGCKTTVEKEIQLNPFPKANFNVTATKGCAPFKVTVNNQSTYADTYEWFLDNVLVSTEKEPQNLVLTEYDKTYTLKLVASNQYGCTVSQQQLELATFPYLKAEFEVKEALSCNGLLDLEVTDRSVGASTYTWDYGDGSPIYVGTNPQHSYGVAGEYNLKLQVSNGFCTDEYVTKIVVSEAPKAAFISNTKSGCNQLTVAFENTSVNASEYLWDFGDGTFSREANPVHHYVHNKDAYTVKLTVTNQYGCSDEVVSSDYINVYPPPEAQIVIEPNKIIKVPNYSFTFNALSDEDLISYRWDFGDGSSADSKKLTHKYDRFGTYKVRLTITNKANCTNVIEDQVTILDFPGYLYMPNAFEPNNLNADLKVFKVKGSGIETYSLKIFNKWGQLIWQTTKLDDQGVPLEYWDGKKDGQLLPQGAYYWQAEATFINGEVWKGMQYKGKSESKVGVIHLIR
jgi:PKD repeat protein